MTGTATTWVYGEFLTTLNTDFSFSVWSWEAAAAQRASGDAGSEAEEDPSHERPSRLQQTDQRKPL